MSNSWDQRDTDPYLNRQPTPEEWDRMIERGARAIPGIGSTGDVPSYVLITAGAILRGALGEAEE